MNRLEYKDSLDRLDKEMRRCLLYLEGLIEERFKITLSVKQPKTPKIDLSRLEAKDDSLQKQISGLRSKVDLAHNHIQEHDESEKSIKILIKRAEQVIDQMQEQFKEIYNSGYYSEGTRRKIRAEGLIKREK